MNSFEIWKVTKISLNNNVKALKIFGTANASSTFRIQIIIFGINDWIIKNFENLIFDVLYDSVSEKFKLFFSVKLKSLKIVLNPKLKILNLIVLCVSSNFFKMRNLIKYQIFKSLTDAFNVCERILFMEVLAVGRGVDELSS